MSMNISDHTCIQELLISEAQCNNCTSWMMEAAEVRTSRKIDFPKNGGQRPSNVKKKPWQYCRPRCGWQTLWAPWRSVPGDQVLVSPWRSDKPLLQELQPFSEIIKTFWNLQNNSFFSGRPAASRDRWVQGSCDHSGLSRVRPVDEVCQVLMFKSTIDCTINDLHPYCRRPWLKYTLPPKPR